jgi:hypothetical protein
MLAIQARENERARRGLVASTGNSEDAYSTASSEDSFQTTRTCLAFAMDAIATIERNLRRLSDMEPHIHGLVPSLPSWSYSIRNPDPCDFEPFARSMVKWLYPRLPEETALFEQLIVTLVLRRQRTRYARAHATTANTATTQ